MTQFILLPWDAYLIRRQDIKGVRVLKVGQGRYAVDVELLKNNGYETIHVQKNVGDKEEAVYIFNQLLGEITKGNITATLKDIEQEIRQMKSVYVWLKDKHKEGTPESFEISGGIEVFDSVLRLIKKYEKEEVES